MPITRDRSGADRLRARLLGPRRYDVLRLDEVVQAGRILFGDQDGLSLYGLAPVDWYARGVRLLGRTCVEATPDITARPIAQTVRDVLGRCPGAGVVDLFAGSGNLMLHVARELSAPACGLDADHAVWQHTDANLHIIGTAARARHGDWRSYFADPLGVQSTVFVISPPWGSAFTFATGLDIVRTNPPIPLIVDTIAARDRSPRRCAVIQHTPVEPVMNASAVTDRHPLLGAGPGCIVVRIQ
jgi:hypothetical protein